MVICPLCLQSTVGEQGEEVTCSHCATRFVAGQPLAAKVLPHPPRKTPSAPRVPVSVMLCALAPFVAPVAAMLTWMFPPIEPAAVLVPLVLLLSGWLAGGFSIVAAKRIGSRWSTVASVAIWASFLELVICCVLFFYLAMASVMPGR
ncbi:MULTISPECIES: hypothetical protein [Corallococcus]|uniref:Uncharacterized protein n=1 Tax=Corallococcus exercitus TaxID=2316736 RepID=A0A7Y4NBT0_9BACT|nr:hypothetical protein [Corallococcus exercitus]NOK08532.1 hypothetical protein [Corallococcus exercitus]